MKRLVFPAALAFVLSGSLALAQQDQPAQQTQPAPQGQSAPQGDASQQPAAPTHRHRKANPNREAKKLSKTLNLTPDQTTKLEPILADRDQKMAALQENTSLSPDDRRTQMRAIHDSSEQQLATVLTPDQVQQMHSMGHKRRGQDAEPASPSPAPAPAPSPQGV